MRRVLLAALVAGAFAGAVAAPASASGPCSRSPGAGGTVSFRSHGRTRSAVVHVPAGAQTGERLPVVIVLHGAGSTGEQMEAYTGMSAVADRELFLAVYPNAVAPHPFWNYYGSTHRADDVGFLRDLIDRIERGRCVDPTRVYATGVSNGGGMTARIGCKLADRLTAIAPVAGGYAHLPPCHPARPLSAMEIHGTADTTVPYDGEGPDHAGSASGYVHWWVAHDGCSAHRSRRELFPGVIRFDWLQCDPGVRVAQVKIKGGTHEWPGGTATRRPPRSSFSASWSVWRFFAKLQLAAPAGR